MTRKLRKFFELNISEKFIIIEASFFLTITALMLKLLGINKTQQLLLKIPLAKSAKILNKSPFQTLIKLIKSASNNLPFNTKCIDEAITLWMMLRKRGVGSYLKIGVNENTEDFKAHAWLEINGKILDISEDSEHCYSDFDYKFFSKANKT